MSGQFRTLAKFFSHCFLVRVPDTKTLVLFSTSEIERIQRHLCCFQHLKKREFWNVGSVRITNAPILQFICFWWQGTYESNVSQFVIPPRHNYHNYYHYYHNLLYLLVIIIWRSFSYLSSLFWQYGLKTCVEQQSP